MERRNWRGRPNRHDRKLRRRAAVRTPFLFSNAAFGYGEFWNTCRFTATLNKNYASDAEPIVIVGVYDEMDDIMDLYTQEVSIDEVGGSVEIDCEFNVNGYYCRVFVWDAATNAPLGYDVKVNKI